MRIALFILAVLVTWLPIAPAQALNNKSWVSSTGSGSTCTRALPCGNFQTAHDQTNAGGEIGVIDSGDYGLLVISKAISIIAEGVDATIVSAGLGSAAITFSGATPPTDVVTLQGLIIDGLGTGGIGISWPFGPALVVKNCVIRNFKNAGSGWGIAVQIAASGRLTVTDTLIVNNGASGVGAGILINPSGGNTSVVLDRVRVTNNFFGIIANGSNGGAVHGTVSDSVVAHSTNNGITVNTANTNGPSVVLSVDTTRVGHNNFGLVATGANAGMLVSNSTVAHNATGLSTSNSGVLLSYKNNNVNANTTDGVFSGIVPQQ